MFFQKSFIIKILLNKKLLQNSAIVYLKYPNENLAIRIFCRGFFQKEFNIMPPWILLNFQIRKKWRQS